MKIAQTIEQLKNRKIGILGVGVEGQATIAYLLRHGVCQLEALDKNEFTQLPPGVKATFGDAYLANLSRFDVIFKSPGFRPDLPQLVSARESGTHVTSAISFFIEHCTAPVVGITGTVGKGTASTIVADALSAAGFTVHLGGNIGKSPLTFLDEVKSSHRVVLEISSFQAMDVSASPSVAGILKTTTEHLDWHVSTEEYRWAKAQLLRHQTAADHVVYNGDASASVDIAENSLAIHWAYSMNRKVPNGVYVNGNQFIFVENNIETILPLQADRVKLAGRFNLENIAAGILLAHLAGGEFNAVCAAAESFAGLPNRLELAAQSQSIRYFNDSYATRPDAAAAAISAFDEPLALIMGGSEKNADFSELFQMMLQQKNIVSLSLIGATAQRMFNEIHALGVPSFSITINDSLVDAMDTAAASLSSGGVLLMTPACASFGLFKNYKERGEQFVKRAREMTAATEA